MSPSLDNELYHYGVLGMKWGVRRSQEELDRAAGRYRDRELSKLQKRYNKKSLKLDKKITKQLKEGKDISKNIKKYAKLVTDSTEESGVLRTANTQYLINERKAVSKNVAKSALLTLGSIPMAALTGVGVISIPNSSAVKTKYRQAEMVKTLGQNYISTRSQILSISEEELYTKYRNWL